MIDRDNLWISVASELQELSKKIKFLESEKSKISKKLQILSGDEDSQGGGFEFKMVVRNGSVSYKDIPELKSVDLDFYRKPSINYWKLTFTEQFKEIL